MDLFRRKSIDSVRNEIDKIVREDTEAEKRERRFAEDAQKARKAMADLAAAGTPEGARIRAQASRDAELALSAESAALDDELQQINRREEELKERAVGHRDIIRREDNEEGLYAKTAQEMLHKIANLFKVGFTSLDNSTPQAVFDTINFFLKEYSSKIGNEITHDTHVRSLLIDFVNNCAKELMRLYPIPTRKFLDSSFYQQICKFIEEEKIIDQRRKVIFDGALENLKHIVAASEADAKELEQMRADSRERLKAQLERTKLFVAKINALKSSNQQK